MIVLWWNTKSQFPEVHRKETPFLVGPFPNSPSSSLFSYLVLVFNLFGSHIQLTLECIHLLDDGHLGMCDKTFYSLIKYHDPIVVLSHSDITIYLNLDFDSTKRKTTYGHRILLTRKLIHTSATLPTFLLCLFLWQKFLEY